MTEIANLQKAISDIMQKAAEGSPDGGGAALQEDIARLQNALNPQSAPVETTPAEGGEAVQEVGKTEGAGPGNRILDSVENIRSHHEKVAAKLQDVIGSVDVAELNPGEALRLQIEIQQVLLQQELMGKIVSKSNQNVDTLLKQQ